MPTRTNETNGPLVAAETGEATRAERHHAALHSAAEEAKILHRATKGELWLVKYWLLDRGWEYFYPWPLKWLASKSRLKGWLRGDNWALTFGLLTGLACSEWVWFYEIVRRLSGPVGTLIGHGITYGIAFLALAFAGTGETMVKAWVRDHPKRLIGQISALTWYLAWCAVGSVFAAMWSSAEYADWVYVSAPIVVPIGAASALQLVSWMLKLYVAGLLRLRSQEVAAALPAPPEDAPPPSDQLEG